MSLPVNVHRIQGKHCVKDCSFQPVTLQTIVIARLNERSFMQHHIRKLFS